MYIKTNYKNTCSILLFLILFFTFQIILYPGWIVSLLAISGSIFANYPLQQANYEPQSGLLNGLYTALPRVVWPMALCFIVFACHFGHGGPVNWFLSLSQWQPFSRLTYAMYLTHFQIILFFVAHNRSPPYFSDLKAVRIIYKFYD